jgi:hypothetical protein
LSSSSAPFRRDRYALTKEEMLLVKGSTKLMEQIAAEASRSGSIDDLLG